MIMPSGQQLLLPANPIHDLDALSKIQMRVRQGRVLGAG